MNKKKKLSIAAVLAAAALWLGGCSPDELLALFEDAKPENSALEAQVAQRRQTLTGNGYNVLRTESEKNAYAAVDCLAQEGSSTVFTIDNDGTPDRLDDILDLYKGDHPEVFWLNDSSSYEYTTHETYTEIRLLYSFSGSELTAAKQRLRDKVNEILSSAPKDADSYEKELWLNDRLVESCEYDEDAAAHEEVIANEQNAYGALVDGRAVCEGYSRAFQLLCSEMGITCVSVNGTAEDESDDGDGNHIWNAVQLDGSWYYVDVTWNDFQPNSDDYHITEIEKHLYFNITTGQLLEDHKISPLYGSSEEADYYNAFIPECSAGEYNYFRKSLLTIRSADDGDALKNALAQAAANGEETFAFCIDEDADFDSVVDDIVGGYAYSWIQDANYQNDSAHRLSDECRFYTYEEINAAAFALEYE